LYISNNVRLLDDVAALWHQTFDNDNNSPVDHLFAVVSVANQTCSDGGKVSYALMTLNVASTFFSLLHFPSVGRGDTCRPPTYKGCAKKFMTRRMNCKWVLIAAGSTLSDSRRGMTDYYLFNLLSVEQLDSIRPFITCLSVPQFYSLPYQKLFDYTQSV
jgi:hypothetical protein